MPLNKELLLTSSSSCSLPKNPQAAIPRVPSVPLQSTKTSGQLPTSQESIIKGIISGNYKASQVGNNSNKVDSLPINVSEGAGSLHTPERNLSEKQDYTPIAQLFDTENGQNFLKQQQQ